MRSVAYVLVLLFTAVTILSSLAGGASAQCVGDCDGNGMVTIDELILGVNMALGMVAPTQCRSFDIDRSGTVTVDELIAAVNNALNGCGFQPPVGVVLAGAPSALAVDATVDLPPVGVDESEIQGGVIMTRLDLHLAPGATVGQVNAALAVVNGGVVSMLHRQPTLTIAIPRPVDLDALATVVQTLRAAPGISWTAIAHVADPKKLPPSPAGDNLDQLQHLLPARFPAAWNASHLATDGCAARKVTVLVADVFQRPPLLGAYADFFDEIPASTFTPLGGPGPADQTHGYDVTTTLAALFNTANPTGANPFTDCLQIDAIQMDGLTESQRVQALPLAFPVGKFLMNYSLGYPDKLSQALIDACTTSACTVREVEQEIDLPLTRAYDGADWISLTSNRWDDFLVSVAAGNERNKPGTAIYSGLGIAAYDAGISVATLLPRVDFLSDFESWNSATIGFPQLVARDADIEAFQQYMQALGVPMAGAADNVLIVGSTTTGRTADALVQSAFSDGADSQGANGPDLFAVGEQIFLLDGGFHQGTSYAAPQVAGLASYLWLLSPDLQNRPVSATRKVILQNVRGVGVIDAYASALSLDAAALPTVTNAPVRLAILDVNDDGKFDETDLDMILNKFFTGEAAPQDYGRFDLNGDGFTGGSTSERFDLDRVGSTQFGTTLYSTVTQSIEGEDISFDEHQLTDLQILCYYAYSALYTGDPDMRRQLTAGHCTISVTVDPAAITLAPGGSQQFAATVRGTSDPRVTWKVVAGDGSIGDTGLFTAGQTPGTVTVRAISVVDPSAFGDATVTVQGTNIPLTDRTCSAKVFGESFSGFMSLLQSKSCGPFPSTPDVNINNSVDLYTYKTNYVENLSATGGTLDIVAEVDAPLVTPGVTTDPNLVEATAVAGLTFTVKGSYLLKVTGRVSTNNIFLFAGPDFGITGGAVPAGPWSTIVVPTTCTVRGDGIPPTCVQEFTFSIPVSDSLCPGCLKPTSVEFGLFATSGFTTVGIVDQQQRKGEVSVTFSFEQQ